MSVRASLAYFVTRGASGALAVMTVSLFAACWGGRVCALGAGRDCQRLHCRGVDSTPLNSSLARFLPRPGFDNLCRPRWGAPS